MNTYIEIPAKSFNYEVSIVFESNRRSAYFPSSCRVVINASDCDLAGEIALKRERETLRRLGFKNVRVSLCGIRNVSLYP